MDKRSIALKSRKYEPPPNIAVQRTASLAESGRVGSFRSSGERLLHARQLAAADGWVVGRLSSSLCLSSGTAFVVSLLVEALFLWWSMNEERLLQLEQRVEQLERRLEQLQAHHASSPTTLVAPVHIVTPDGHVMVSIEQRQHDQSIGLFNAHGTRVAALGVDGTNAGYLAIGNAAGALVGYLDVETSGARLQVNDHRAEGGVVLFGGESGSDSGGGIHINHSAGGVSISLWSTPTGGEMNVYDTSEEVVVTLPAPKKE